MSSKYNILYVDDELDNLTGFKAVFRRHYNIFSAQSGEEAIETLRNHPINLIISDQRMPTMTGVELFEKILPDFPDAIRMILTGYSDVQAIVDAINKGKVYHYITKPWKVEELKNIMDRALEAYSLMQKNKRLEQEKHELTLNAERLKMENILSQFEILKNQINPHFLFNSMNILTSLIPEDPTKAVTFAHKFSKVYRQLLELREQLTIDLNAELNFIQSFLFLQQIRFEEALDIELTIPETFHQHHLPPFTLQLLIENAIKHNIVSEDEPLQIQIFVEEDELWVKNQLQPRGTPADSTQIGLSNLKARYQLVTERKPFFGPVNDHFVARVPLLLPVEFPPSADN